eukprot:CAMPEP_0194038732 /NCGR_PEP_ID=MMETSP0009_2-20130614/10935_1 /TAXON_ID=210454 /ORGANISM="Grammatophora oceanica, Strain CCMP 410" /LENGTH=462 /DNA_ID=CAMNT_0038681325 /DNA_START=130 /DNA_END=1518 /DNA_ORIENTATION=+
MGVPRRWALCALVVLVLSTCCTDVVNAKKDKEPAPAPVEAPAQPTWESPTWESPVEEPEPTDPPVETPQPTPEPSPLPTPVPSTPAPSAASSAAPSVSPRPSVTQEEELDDTSVPTTTMAPTQTAVPSSAPIPTTSSPTGPLVQVRMPEMELTLRIVGNSVDPEAVSTSLGTFVQESVVNSVSTFPGFASAVIDVDVQTFSTGRRKLQGRTIVMAEAKGEIFFTSDSQQPTPTEKDLESVLVTYFSYWGDDDLETNLQESNGYIVDDMEIVIDGKVVDGVPAGNGSDEGNPNGLTDEGRQRVGASPGLIAGLVIGCVALFVSILLLVWQRRKDKLKAAEQMATDTSLIAIGGGDTSLDAAPLMEAASNGTSPKHVSSLGGDDDQLSFGGISLEDSIYTTNTMEQNNPPSLLDNTMEASYDAKRLDKVISDAHNYVRSQAEDRGSLPTDPTLTASDSTSSQQP